MRMITLRKLLKGFALTAALVCTGCATMCTHTKVNALETHTIKRNSNISFITPSEYNIGIQGEFYYNTTILIFDVNFKDNQDNGFILDVKDLQGESITDYDLSGEINYYCCSLVLYNCSDDLTYCSLVNWKNSDNTVIDNIINLDTFNTQDDNIYYFTLSTYDDDIQVSFRYDNSYIGLGSESTVYQDIEQNLTYNQYREGYLLNQEINSLLIDIRDLNQDIRDYELTITNLRDTLNTKEEYIASLEQDIEELNYALDAAIATQNLPTRLTEWIQLGASALERIFNIEVLPYIKVGYFIALPILFALVSLILKLVRGA